MMSLPSTIAVVETDQPQSRNRSSKSTDRQGHHVSTMNAVFSKKPASQRVRGLVMNAEALVIKLTIPGPETAGKRGL